jgi:hypothetical protein
MLVRCLNNKGFEAMLELDRVYNVCGNPLQNSHGFIGFFIQLPNQLSVYFEAKRFEVCSWHS